MAAPFDTSPVPLPRPAVRLLTSATVSSSTLTTVDDLDALIERAKALLAPMPRRVHIEIPNVPADVVTETTARLSAYLAACGCVAGSMAGSLALLTALVGSAMADGMPWHWPIGRWALVGAVSLGASLVGKFAGHVRARRKVVGALTALRGRLAAT